MNGTPVMRTLLARLRAWLLIKLAAGRPVAINLKLTRGLYLYETDGGLFVNVQVDPSKENPKAPEDCGAYLSA